MINTYRQITSHTATKHWNLFSRNLAPTCIIANQSNNWKLKEKVFPLIPCSSMVRVSHSRSSEGYRLYTHHLSPCSSMVTASHWSSEGYRLYTYVTFTHYLSPCSSMVRASHWSSEGYRLYTYVTFTYHLSQCSSMVRASHWSSEGYRLYIYEIIYLLCAL